MCLNVSSDRVRLGSAAILIAATLTGAAPPACAQASQQPTTTQEDMLALLAPVPLSTKNPLLRPQREYQGMRLGDWLLYPALAVGATYSDNVAWTSKRPVSAGGLRVAPSFSAAHEGDGGKLVLFSGADAKFYPTQTRANALNAEAGGLYEWKVTPDLIVKAAAKYARDSQPIGSGYVQTRAGLATMIAPLVSDRVQGSLAVQKTFGRAFVGLSYETIRTAYSSLDTSLGSAPQNYRDSWVNVAAARAGLWATPVLYVFGEASGNKRDYSEAPYGSKGYRALVGLGSDRISLFRGELYAGYQQQFYDGRSRWSATSPVFGGKVFWYPTRDLTVRVALDQSFTDSSLPTPANPLGYPARATRAELSMQQQVTRGLFLAWRLQYEYDRYLRSSRTDDRWRTGVGLVYSATRNIDLTLDYEYENASSTDAAARFHRNSASAGMKYRF